MEWLKEDVTPLDAAAKRELTEQLQKPATALRSGRNTNLAIRLRDVVIHDTKKWFGDAEVRLDVLVIHGPNPKAAPEEFYKPTTLRFKRVADGDRLPIGDGGLLVFYGKPRHFVDISITASRDRKDTEDLSKVIGDRIKGNDFKVSATTILGLTAVAPQAAAVVGAIQAASTLANTSAEVLLQITSGTIGLYHTSYLQYRDRFGLGRHPETGSFTIKDFSFSYEVVVDERAQPTV